MKTFTDEDLRRLKLRLNNDYFMTNKFKGGAAERICIWAKGICPDTMEKRWRESKGERG